MRTSKELTLEQLASALARLSPQEFESLVEILERKNLITRRKLVHRELQEGKVISEEKLFADLLGKSD